MRLISVIYCVSVERRLHELTPADTFETDGKKVYGDVYVKRAFQKTCNFYFIFIISIFSENKKMTITI